MSYESVREAYSAMAEQYVALLDGDWLAREDGTGLVRRHLTGLTGPVLDLGCGPGHWTAYLHALGVDVAGIDLVPEFIEHARREHPGPEFHLGSMTVTGWQDGSVAGLLSWFSTIHLPPTQLDDVLAGFRRLLRPDGVLVVGFFDSEDGVAPFDHKVVQAYRWPVDAYAERLAEAGFTELERVQTQLPDRPDRRYAALAARAC